MNSLTESIIGTAYLSIASLFSLKLYVHSPGSGVNIFILHNDVIYLKILKMIGLADEHRTN